MRPVVWALKSLKGTSGVGCGALEHGTGCQTVLGYTALKHPVRGRGVSAMEVRQRFATAGSTLQLMARSMVAAQPTAGSPSNTVSVTVTGPALVQVNRGLVVLGSSKVPLGADHWSCSGAGPASLS